MKKLLIALMMISMLATTMACTKNESSNVRSNKEVGRIYNVEKGTIMEVKHVEIKGDKVVETMTGAVIGGIAGAFIGGTTTVNVIMGTTGAIAGGYLGHKIAGNMKDGEGYEYIIKMDSGDVVRVVQAKDSNNYFYTGDRVLVKFGEKDTMIERTR